MSNIKVLIVDDSAVVRQVLTKILSADTEIDVIASANDPFIAVKKIEQEMPNVIISDIEMPNMDGLTFLKKIMTQHPIPVIICSSLAGDKSDAALKALEFGAVDVIAKPQMGTKSFFEESSIRIIDSVKAATKITPRKLVLNSSRKKLNADVILPKVIPTLTKTTEKVIVVGASTGGTEALKTFLMMMPQNSPGIVIVQHMPEHFTKSFSDRLNSLCKIEVREAKNGDRVMTGRALIAPGNKHMLLKRSGAKYYVELKDGPLVSRHRPSVDVLFRSAARYGGKNCVGVIMTGMGDDGAKGMLEMRDAGAFNIGQNEKTCVVYGMPNEANKIGAVNIEVNLEKIAENVLKNI